MGHSRPSVLEIACCLVSLHFWFAFYAIPLSPL